MKKTILPLVFILTTASSFAQTTSTDVKTKEYYITKSRHQKTIGWIMLGGGVALTGLGIAIGAAETIDYALGSSSNTGAGTAFVIVGAASTLGSIPFFISAGHNKSKAAELAFNMQPVPTLNVTKKFATTFQPSLMLKIFL
jgi:hypothetical protein